MDFCASWIVVVGAWDASDAEFMAFKESTEAEPESLGSVDAWLDEHLLQKEQGVAYEPTPLLKFLAAKHEARRAVRRSKVQAQKKPIKPASGGGRGKPDTVRLVVVRVWPS